MQWNHLSQSVLRVHALALGLTALVKPSQTETALLWTANVLQVQVSDQPLTAFGVRDDGVVLGCGTADGCCSVMQLSSALVDIVPNEKQTVNAMFERETLRCVHPAAAAAVAGRQFRTILAASGPPARSLKQAGPVQLCFSQGRCALR